jgi:uncharacterized protein (TIGR03000 family)
MYNAPTYSQPNYGPAYDAPIYDAPMYDSSTILNEGGDVDGSAIESDVMDDTSSILSGRQSTGRYASYGSNVRADEIHISIGLPASAKVFVNGNETTSTGDLRHFVSRGVSSNDTYRFEIRAEMEQDGKVVSESRQIILSGGQTQELNFDLESEGTKVETSLALDVPEGATVVLAGNTTATEGENRVYKTRQLVRGEAWDDYTIEVSYAGETKTQTIRLIGGDTLAMAFAFDTERDQPADSDIAVN